MSSERTKARKISSISSLTGDGRNKEDSLLISQATKKTSEADRPISFVLLKTTKILRKKKVLLIFRPLLNPSSGLKIVFQCKSN